MVRRQHDADSQRKCRPGARIGQQHGQLRGPYSSDQRPIQHHDRHGHGDRGSDEGRGGGECQQRRAVFASEERNDGQPSNQQRRFERLPQKSSEPHREIGARTDRAKTDDRVVFRRNQRRALRQHRQPDPQRHHRRRERGGKKRVSREPDDRGLADPEGGQESPRYQQPHCGAPCLLRPVDAEQGGEVHPHVGARAARATGCSRRRRH